MLGQLVAIFEAINPHTLAISTAIVTGVIFYYHTRQDGNGHELIDILRDSMHHFVAEWWLPWSCTAGVEENSRDFSKED